MITGAGFDGDAKRFIGFGQPLIAVAEITQSCFLEAAASKLVQQWEDALAIVPICWGDVDRQRESILSNDEMEHQSRGFHDRSVDFPAAMEVAVKTVGHRTKGPVIDDDNVA